MDGQDRCNYRAAFDKLAIAFDLEPSRTIGDGIAEILSAVTKRRSGISRSCHSNVRALVETVARRGYGARTSAIRAGKPVPPA